MAKNQNTEEDHGGNAAQPGLFPGDEDKTVQGTPGVSGSPDKYDGEPVAVWQPKVPGVEKRIIKNADYEPLGAPLEEDLVFTPQNRHTVPLKGLSNAAIELLRQERNMVIKGA